MTILLAALGTLALAYAATIAFVAQRMTRAERRTPAHADLVGYDTVRLYSRRDSVPLTASYVPAPRPQRAVILVHGRGGCRGDEFASGSSSSLVSHLVQHGFSVLLLDLRGHGESGPGRLTYGLRERFDVLGAVDWLLDRGFRPGQIGVLGASMGAVSAILATAEESAIGALVADSAFADFPAMMRAWFRRMSGLPTAFLSGALLVGRLFMGLDLARHRPVEEAARLTVPTLVIHAIDDRLVPHRDALEIVRAARAEHWFTPGKKHLAAFQTQPEAYASRVTAFFDRHLERGLPGPRRSSPEALSDRRDFAANAN